MDFLQIHFPIAGVEIPLFIPPAVAFIISFFTSMAGISGAFLILPFQVSVLGFTAPSVSSTNFLYNVVGTPGGVLRYAREKRMVWPLAGSIIAGTLPGVLIGYYFRVKLLPDPRTFKFFVGIVLLYVGWRLLNDIGRQPVLEKSNTKAAFLTCDMSARLRAVSFSFMGERFCFSVPAIFIPSLCVGIISGIYGIGGGAIIAPFLVTIMRLPIYAVAGAVLLANFVTSLTGVFFYSTIPLNQGQVAPPDWLLGVLFGVGGLIGMYCGAKWQRFMPEKIIKCILAIIIFIVSGKYIFQYF
jgi:uncharacterized membrane protein YfcA